MGCTGREAVPRQEVGIHDHRVASRHQHSILSHRPLVVAALCTLFELAADLDSEKHSSKVSMYIATSPPHPQTCTPPPTHPPPTHPHPPHTTCASTYFSLCAGLQNCCSEIPVGETVYSGKQFFAKSLSQSERSGNKTTSCDDYVMVPSIHYFTLEFLPQSISHTHALSLIRMPS